jgi:hypothetical protein
LPEATVKQMAVCFIVLMPVLMFPARAGNIASTTVKAAMVQSFQMFMGCEALDLSI